MAHALSAWSAPGPFLRSSAGTRTELAGTSSAMAKRHSVKARYVSERGSKTLRRGRGRNLILILEVKTVGKRRSIQFNRL